MSKFTTLIPALAVAMALSPLAAKAAFQHDQQKAGYVASSSISSQLAVNSKGRPSEFTPAASNEVAANSKGRPSEFTPAAANEVAVNSKGRPGEYAVQVADNSKGRPGEFATPGYETPIG